MTALEGLREIVKDHIYGSDYMYIYEKDPRGEDLLRMVLEKLINDATIDQLWAVYRKFIIKGCLFEVSYVIPDDMIGLRWNGLFYAVLPDGSIHT